LFLALLLGLYYRTREKQCENHSRCAPTFASPLIQVIFSRAGNRLYSRMLKPFRLVHLTLQE